MLEGQGSQGRIWEFFGGGGGGRVQVRRNFQILTSNNKKTSGGGGVDPLPPPPPDPPLGHLLKPGACPEAKNPGRQAGVKNPSYCRPYIGRREILNIIQGFRRRCLN